MSKIILYFLIFFCFSSINSAIEVKFKSENVIPLNEEEFFKKTENPLKIEPMIVYFYKATKPCKRYAKVIDKIADRLINDPFKLPFKVYSIDLDKSPKILQNKHFIDYPTTNIFYYAYEGSLPEKIEENSLYQQLKKIYFDPLVVLNSLEEINNLKEESPYLMMCTIDPNTEDPLLKKEYEEYFNYAKNETAHNQLLLSVCFSEDCIKKYPPPIKAVYFRHRDEKSFALKEGIPLTQENLIIFEALNKYQIGGNFSQLAFYDLFHYKENALFYFRSAKKEGQFIKDDLILKIANKHKLYSDFEEKNPKIKGFQSFFLSEIENKGEEMLYYFYGIEEDELPILLISEPNAQKTTLYKFPMKSVEDLKEEEIEKWIKDFEEGKLIPEKRTQQIPKKQPEDCIIVVRKNFKKEVLEDKKNVLILSWNIDQEAIYSRFKNAWNKMKKVFKEELKDLQQKLKIVELNIKLNDIENIPSDENAVYLFKEGEKEKPLKMILKNEGKNPLEEYEIVDWICEQLGHKKVERAGGDL